jgi:3-isopropylmalate/(R)-2-methylmalate dehydratase small subunit
VTVSAEFADKLFAAILQDPTTELEINLPEQKIKLLSTGESECFDINEYKKDNMTNGFDDIDYLLNMSSEIDAFAKGK